MTGDRVELTGAGLVVRDDAGTVVASLTFASGEGHGAVLITTAAAGPIEILLTPDQLGHLRDRAAETCANARLTALHALPEDAADLPRVPRYPVPRAPHLPI